MCTPPRAVRPARAPRPALKRCAVLLLFLAAASAADTCDPHSLHGFAVKCAAASAPACAPRGARVPYTRLWFCAPRAARPLLALAAGAWVAALLALMAAISSRFLVPTVEWCATFLHVPPALAGVTLLAVAAGAPDLATEVAAVLAAGPGEPPDDGALAAAVAVGTSLAVLAGGLAAAGVAARARGGAAFPSGAAAARDGGAYALATVAVGAVLWDGSVSVGEAAMLLALYVAYVALAVAVGRHGGPLSGATGTDVAAALRARGGVAADADGLPAAPPSAFYGLDDAGTPVNGEDIAPTVTTAGEVQLTTLSSSSRRRAATAAGGLPRAASPLAPPPTPRHAASADGVGSTPTHVDGSGSSSARSSTASLLPSVAPLTGAGAPTPAATSLRGGSHAGDGGMRRASRASASGRGRHVGGGGGASAALRAVAAAVAARIPRFEALTAAPRLRAVLRVAATPAALALHATIPCLAADAPPFGPGAAAALALTAPPLALEFLGAGPARVGWPAFCGAAAAASLLLTLALAPRFIASRFAPVPPRTPLLAGLALAAAGAWLAAAADEAVDALRAGARAVGAPAELASALLAWGGAIPELVAVAALARAGAAGATAALHSAAAGPVFNLLVALPLPAALAAVRHGGGPVFGRALALTLTNGVVVLLAGTLLLLAFLAVALPAASWRVSPRFAGGLLAAYAAVQIAFLAVEGGVWRVPVAPSAKKSLAAAAAEQQQQQQEWAQEGKNW